jgi:hypothetical protein
LNGRVWRAVALLAALAALSALSACGGGHSKAPPGLAVADTVRTADCHLWTTLNAGNRLRLVEGMRMFFGGQTDVPGQVGGVLSDERAAALFDGYCAPPYAGAFKLYKIYGPAAAFTPPAPAPPPAQGGASG